MYVVLFLVLDFEYLFDNMNILKHMAGVVKWLRPRIVVPLCVGSNPTTRPIIKISTLYGCLFYFCDWDENPTKRSLVWVRAQAEQRLKPSAKLSSGRLDK